MNLLKNFSGIMACALVLPGLISCASADHLPAADRPPVLLASAEEAHYASDILNITENKNQTNEGDDKDRHTTELPYVCPMHADVQSDKPGKCPKCGMQLQLREKTAVPPKETGHEHH